MKLKEIFDNLRYGELKMLSIGGQPQGVINNSNQSTLVSAVNMGLTALHARFNLRERNVKVVLVPGVYSYTLKPDYLIANTMSKVAVKYLEAVDYPFTDSLLKIEQIGTVEGELLGLNDGRAYSCMTPSTHVLRVHEHIVDGHADLPESLKTTALFVAYRDNHPLLVPEDNGVLDDGEDEIEIDLPYPYMEPLLYYIASRMHHPMGLAGDFQMGASYSAKYEQSCQRLEGVNLQSDKGQFNNRLERNGWV